MNGEIGSEDLGQVSPLGDEDDYESGQGGLSVRCNLGLDDLLLTVISTSFFRDFTQGEQGTGKEDARDETFDRPMRHNPEQDDTDRYGDHDVNDEGAGRSKPYRQGLPSCRQHKRGNIVLSGSSPRKMIGNTLAAMARFMVAFPPGRRRLRPGHVSNTA